MATVSTMILRALRMIGEKERGDTLDSDEQTECLDELNTMLESWSLNRLTIYSITEATHTLTASTSTYTIGTNGTISSIQRPIRITDPCFIRDSSGYDTPVTVLNKENYDAIVDKDAGFVVPIYLFYDAGYSATSTGTIAVYPSPSGGLTLHINCWVPLQNFPSVSTTVLLPPGYKRAIESNYAIEAAGGYSNAPPEVASIARESFAWLQSINLPSPVMRMDAGNVIYGTGAWGGSRRNILTG